MTLYSVRVLHNVSGDMFWGYRPETSKLYHAHEFTVIADNLDGAANLMWLLANIGGSDELAMMRPDLVSQYGEEVDLYRKRCNRSLSVGDVLVFYSESMSNPQLAGVCSVASMGFNWLEFMPKVEGELREFHNCDEHSQAFLAHLRFKPEETQFRIPLQGLGD